MRYKHNPNQYRQTKILDFFSKIPSATQKVNEIKVEFNTNKFKNKTKPKTDTDTEAMEIEEDRNIYVLRFDGASKGNPGKAGAGAVIYLNNNELWDGSKYIGNRFTCNYAEYSALILGLKEAINRNIKILYVEGDSQLVINQLNGKFKVKSKNLIDLYTEAKNLSKKFDKIYFKHIYRQFNTRADELANLLINK